MSDQADSLSEREVEILRLVATGASNKEIASSLVISPNTVKVHLRNIFAKIGVASRTEATLYAIKHGFVAQPGAVLLSPEDEEPAEPTPAEDEIYRSSPFALANEVQAGGGAPLEAILPPPGLGETIPEGPRAAGPARWIALAILAFFLLAAAASAYAYLNRTPPAAPLPTPAPTATKSILSRWAEETSLPQPLTGMGMSLYEGRYYLIGGSDGQSTLSKVYRLDPTGKRWEALANKPTAASHIQAALLGERIYVPGGLTANGKPSDILEVYDPRHDTWESRQPLPVALSDYALAPFEGKLYLFGGFNGSAYSAEVYIYNPDTNAWKKGSPLPSARSLASAVALEGKIMLCGGFDGKQALKQVLNYYPNRDSDGEPAWENGPDLPQGRFAMSSASLSNLVYLFGGQSSAPGSQTAGELSGLMFSLDSGRWAALDQFPLSTAGEGAAIADGNLIHVFGGQSAPSDQHLVYHAIYTIAIPLSVDNK